VVHTCVQVAIKYYGKNRRDPNFKIQKYRWNKKIQDYIPIN